jgi:hypothetical protein
MTVNSQYSVENNNFISVVLVHVTLLNTVIQYVNSGQGLGLALGLLLGLAFMLAA